MNSHRPLILGSLITQLAVHEQLIDIRDKNLHVACEMMPLDLSCLDMMGLLDKQQGSWCFTELRMAMTQRGKQFRDAAAHDQTTTSSSMPLSTSLIEKIEKTVEKLDHIERKIIRLEYNTATFFQFMQSAPPPPSI